MHHILHSGQAGITRMLPYDPVGGLTLEDWTPSGLHEVTLPPDAVQALLRQLPLTVIQEAFDGQVSVLPTEPSVWHWMMSRGRAVCGSDEPDNLTPVPQHVTCAACLEAWQSACQAIPAGPDTLNAERG